MDEQGVRVAVSVTRKINLGNYESVDVFLAVSNIPTDISDDEIDDEVADALRAGERVYDRIREQIVQQTDDIKNRA